MNQQPNNELRKESAMTRIGFSESHYDSFTGAQQSMLPLLRDATQYDSILFTPKRGKCTNNFERHGIQTDVIEYPARLDRFGSELLDAGLIDKGLVSLCLLRYYLKVARSFRRHDIDLLYCNNVRSVFLFGPPAKAMGIPVIWYVRGDMSKPRFDSIAFRIADRVITISDGVRGKFDPTDIDKNSDKFKTIYTGVDPEEFNPDSDYQTDFGLDNGGQLNIVEVATIHPRKRQENLIEAMDKIDQVMPEYNLIFAGPTAEGCQEYERSLQELVDEKGLGSNVYFLGWCDEIPALLSKTDLFVLPSAHEGFPRSILEASAMGVPTIATPAGGTAELVDDGETGFIVPIDDVAELANAILYLCQDHERRSEIGNVAQSKVLSEFTVVDYVENFEQFISKVVRQYDE